jgi:hypothetical protein
MGGKRAPKDLRPLRSIGRRLSRSLPTGWWFVELAVIGAGLGCYWRRSRVDGSFGARAWAVAIIVLLLHLISAPWLSTI